MPVSQRVVQVCLLAPGVFLAGIGRLVSISQVGLPELLLPVVIVVARMATARRASQVAPVT